MVLLKQQRVCLSNLRLNGWRCSCHLNQRQLADVSRIGGAVGSQDCQVKGFPKSGCVCPQVLLGPDYWACFRKLLLVTSYIRIHVSLDYRNL